MAAAEPKPSLVERLFAEQRGGLQAFFQGRTRSKADAPDLGQEVYLRMLRIRDREVIRNPVHYLYTVANNLVKEHALLERRRRAASTSTGLPDPATSDLPKFQGHPNHGAGTTNIQWLF